MGLKLARLGVAERVSTIDVLASIAVVVGGYLLGSVPIGALVCRVGFRVDILDQGSGRSGATNVLRTVGVGAAGIVLMGDVLKGLIPVLVGRIFFGHLPLVPILAGLAAMTGHNWSIFLGFRGGRGVATSFGTFMAVAPITALVGLPLGVGTIAIARYVSLGSLVGALGFLAATIVFYALGLGVTGYHLFLIAVINVFLISQHWDNLQRLFAGTERRLAPWPDVIAGWGGRHRGSTR